MTQIIYLTTFLMPIIVLPQVLDNCFNTPKTLTLLLGVGALISIKFKDLRELPAPALMLILFNFLTLFYTQNPYYTKVAIVLNVSCIIFWFYTAKYLKNVEFLCWIVTFSGIICAIFTIIQYCGYYPLMPWMTKNSVYISTIGNSNYAGAYFIFPLFTTLGLFFTVNRKWKIVALTALIVISTAFFIEQARASWLGFFVGVIIFIALHVKLIGRRNILLMFMFGLFGLFLMTCQSKYVFNMNTFRLRFIGYIPPAIEIWKDNPLLGTGLWSYRNLVYDAQVKLSKRIPNYFERYDQPKPRKAHNDYAEALVDGGIIGVILCLWFIWWVFERRMKDFLSTVFMCGIISIFVNAFFFFPFRFNLTLFMTCIFLGAICREETQGGSL